VFVAFADSEDSLFAFVVSQSLQVFGLPIASWNLTFSCWNALALPKIFDKLSLRVSRPMPNNIFLQGLIDNCAEAPAILPSQLLDSFKKNDSFLGLGKTKTTNDIALI